MARVKPIFRRRSGVRKIRAMALNKNVPPEKLPIPEGRLKDQGNPSGNPGLRGPNLTRVV
ncbi:hypothetical protein GCM10010458_34900 [Microbacterium luteolum]